MESTAQTADVSLDTIVAEAFAETESAGGAIAAPEGVTTDTPVDVDAAEQAAIDKAMGLEPEAPAAATAGEQSAPAAAAEPPPETESAARARKILAAAAEKEKAAREHVENSERTFASGLRAAPRATLAKLGLTIDELIDASLVEGQAPAAAAPEDRVTALERRLLEREHAEKQAAIDREKVAIQERVKADKALEYVHRAMAKEPDIVADFMIEYHATHGKPIAWDKAAALVNADLRALAGAPLTAPAAAPQASKVAPVAPRKETAPAPQRPDPPTLTNQPARAAVPEQEEDPTIGMSPDKAIEWLVAHAS